MKERSLPLAQFVLVIGVALALFIAWDFGHHLLSNFQLTTVDAQLDDRLANAAAQNQKLAALKKEVQTDNWVIKFVRTYWHWTKEGETIAVPRATAVPTATPIPPPSVATPAPRQFWDDWLDAIFGPAQ